MTYTRDDLLAVSRDFELVEWLIRDPDMIDFVMERYAEPHRYYHTIVHIAHMIVEAEHMNADMMECWPTLSAAIVFHDIVYDPTRSDNEHKSAVLAALRLPADACIDIPKVCEMIEATKHHRSDDEITQFLIDIDMEVLSWAWPFYAKYARQIRREYAHVPLDQYVAGRTAFLSGELKKEGQFFYGDRHYGEDKEAHVRRNLATEIGYLTVMPEAFLEEVPQSSDGGHASSISKVAG